MKRSKRWKRNLGRCDRCGVHAPRELAWCGPDDEGIAAVEFLCLACHTAVVQLELFAGLDASR